MLDYISSFIYLTPRKTKRRITQEMEEWDEDVEEGDNRSEPELEWGFMADKTESKPVHSNGVLSAITLKKIMCCFSAP